MTRARKRALDFEQSSAASERMVVFLKEQLIRAGVSPSTPASQDGEAELKRINVLLVKLLAQIPTGVRPPIVLSLARSLLHLNTLFAFGWFV